MKESPSLLFIGQSFAAYECEWIDITKNGVCIGIYMSSLLQLIFTFMIIND